VQHAFGSSAPLTLGLEEELLLVDPRTHRLAHVAERVLASVELPESLAAHEAFASEVELRTPVCRNAHDAANALDGARTAARAAGATLMGAGLHPVAEWGDVRLTEKERYRTLEDTMRTLIRRTPECALHVHVGAPDPEGAIRILNGLRVHLPMLQGLAANSPWWFGSDSGLGHLILQDNAQLETARVFAATAVLSAIALAIFGLLVIAERRIVTWR